MAVVNLNMDPNQLFSIFFIISRMRRCLVKFFCQGEGFPPLQRCYRARDQCGSSLRDAKWSFVVFTRAAITTWIWISCSTSCPTRFRIPCAPTASGAVGAPATEVATGQSSSFGRMWFEFRCFKMLFLHDTIFYLESRRSRRKPILDVIQNKIYFPEIDPPSGRPRINYWNRLGKK